MRKKIICYLIIITFIITLFPATVFATQTECERPLQFEENIAVELKKLNLFKGVSETDFALRKVPTRMEALVIMLRLMGKESEILAGAYTHPFTDVPSWANNYVGYAYENGLTKGISARKFGTDNATDVQFLAFVLRAMGYSDADGDFTWDNPYDLAEDLGVLDCSVTTGSGFLRADCASISYNTLSANLKDGSGTLADKLIGDGVFTRAAYDAAVRNVPDYAGLLKAYEVDYLEWNNNPITEQDYYDNFFYSFIRGAWEYDTRKTEVETCEWYACNPEFKLRDIAVKRCDLLGSFLEQVCIVYRSNGQYYIWTIGGIPQYSKDDIMHQLIQVYETAKEIQEDIRSKKLVSDNTSQLKIAQVYSDYLINYGCTVSEPFRNSNFPENYNRIDVRIQYQKEDSAYGALCEREATCGGRAAAYNVLMHIEGIHSVGYPVEGHVLSYANLDGEYYMVDWGNQIGVFKPSELNKKGFEYDGIASEYAEEFANTNKLGSSNPVEIHYAFPELILEYIGLEGDDRLYYIELADKNYNGHGMENFNMIFGMPISGLKLKLTLNDLRKGVIFDRSNSLILEKNIAEEVIILNSF